MMLSPHAHLTPQQANELPDSSFALVLPSGKKDQDGKTIPRGYRRALYRDSSGVLIAPEAHASLRELNEMRPGDAPLEARVAAWGAIVGALKVHYKRGDFGFDYVPPPRKF